MFTNFAESKRSKSNRINAIDLFVCTIATLSFVLTDPNLLYPYTVIFIEIKGVEWAPTNQTVRKYGGHWFQYAERSPYTLLLLYNNWYNLITVTD